MPPPAPSDDPGSTATSAGSHHHHGGFVSLGLWSLTGAVLSLTGTDDDVRRMLLEATGDLAESVLAWLLAG